MKGINEEFLSALKNLAGKRCWGVAAGEGTGSVVALDCGDKIPRDRPLRNVHLAEDQRRYKAELSLFIWCSWRLDSDTEVICGATDPNDNDGPMINGLMNLPDRRVESVDALLPGLDLTLRFDGPFCLRVFCDETNIEDDYENYSFFTDSRIYTVNARSVVSYENVLRKAG
ncbi:hypothetical protein QUF72_04550 [Desulfobacterales bacterium HSG2]|nr:hypothetical protein [Desulfobacterales bacterium HSG2]